MYSPNLEQQIASWFRWQNNPIRLGRSAAVRGVLKFDTVLAGGVNLKGTRAPQKIDVYSNKYYKEKIKHAADDAIEKEHITNRGPKLQKRREITRRIYSDESEAVKAKIDKKYEKIKARYVKQRQRLKSGKPPKIDDMSKIKYVPLPHDRTRCSHRIHLIGLFRSSVPCLIGSSSTLVI